MTEQVTKQMSGLLRPEARPATWQQLSEPQHEATLKILRLLFNAVQDAKKDQVPDNKVPWLDRDRASQLAFLAGARGAGKTTVLMSAARAVSAGQFSGPSSTESLGHEVAAMLPELARSVIWLEPIDAEPESTQTNMLAAIVARIERAAENYTNTSADADHHGLTDFDPDTPAERALAKLSRLQTSMALAWAKSSVPNADADTFAIEVRRRERAKLGIQQELNVVLRELGEHVFAIKRPVFVLPVDDIDLNPRLCADLIKLLRSVAVPHLFAIALGDISLTEFVMQLNYTAEFKANGADLNWLDMDRSTVARRITEVAAHNLRKLIPPQQRIHLTNVSVESALNFVPLGHKDAAHLESLLSLVQLDVTPTLKSFAALVSGSRRQPDATAAVRAAHDVDPLKVLDLLLTPRGQVMIGRGTPEATSPPPDTSIAARLSVACYQGRLHLETTLRRLTDIWAIWAVQAPRNARDDAPASLSPEAGRELVRQLWGHLASVLNEEGRVSAYATVRSLTRRGEASSLAADELQKAFRLVPRVGDAVTIRSDGTEPEQLTFSGADTGADGGGDVVVVEVIRHPAEIESDPTNAFECKFHVWHRWDLAVRLEPNERQASTTKGPANTLEQLELPRHVVATVLLVHDLSQMLSSSEPSRGLMRFASEIDAINTLAETSWLQGRGSAKHVLSFAWPIPNCVTTWQWDWFAAAWSDRVRDSGWLARNLEEVALTWMLLGTSVLDGTPSEHAGSTQLWSRLFGRSGRLSELARGTAGRSPRIREWLLDCCALLMPEYGVFRYRTASKPLGAAMTAFIAREGDALFAGHKRRIDRLKNNAGESVAELLRQETMRTESPFSSFERFW